MQVRVVTLKTKRKHKYKCNSCKKEADAQKEVTTVWYNYSKRYLCKKCSIETLNNIITTFKEKIKDIAKAHWFSYIKSYVDWNARAINDASTGEFLGYFFAIHGNLIGTKDEKYIEKLVTKHKTEKIKYYNEEIQKLKALVAKIEMELVPVGNIKDLRYDNKYYTTFDN